MAARLTILIRVSIVRSVVPVDVEARTLVRRSKCPLQSGAFRKGGIGQGVDIERLNIGKMVADGKTPIPGRTNVRAGTILYKVLWDGYPPEIATWEEADNIHDDYIDVFEDALEGGEGDGAAADDSDDDE